MSDSIVEINNLNKTIKNKVILNNINLKLKKGNIYGIIGRNGSGKSMLFKAMCGLIKPTSGEIFIFTKPIHKGELPEDTGAIIENPGFIGQCSAFKNLKMLASINSKIGDDDIRKIISLVGLDPNDAQPVKKFSLGMKQRLGIAQAIMEKPKFLILDEPMNALDEEGVELVRSILLKLKENGVTILMASHNKEDIEVLCDYVYKMKNGILTINS